MDYMEIDGGDDDINNYRSLDLLEDLEIKLVGLQSEFKKSISQQEKRLKIIKEVKNYKELIIMLIGSINGHSGQLGEEIEKLDQLLKVPIKYIGENKQRSLIIGVIENITWQLMQLAPLIHNNNNNNGLWEEVWWKGNIIKNEFENLGYLSEITNKDLLKRVLESLNPDHLMEKYLYYRYLQTIQNLNSPRYTDLRQICEMADIDDRTKEFNKYFGKGENIEKLLELFPIILSTNISAQKLGTPKTMFDLVIMDEAGQCNIPSSLIPLTKARNLLLVGDPNQLRPIIKMEEEVNRRLMMEFNVPPQYDYRKYSIFDVMVSSDKASNTILLKNHYRCGRKIIGFSNHLYYHNELELTDENGPGVLELLSVNNKNTTKINEAFDEAQAIIDYIIRNRIEDAFIVTPFVHQKLLINRLLMASHLHHTIKCDTIHSLQGAEKNTIIFSTAISLNTSQRTFNWIKNNEELINVAVTRAQSQLIIAADTEAIDVLSRLTQQEEEGKGGEGKGERRDLGLKRELDGNQNQNWNQDRNQLQQLIDYIKDNGHVHHVHTVTEAMVATPLVERGHANGGTAETEFLKTIEHLCSCHSNFSVVRNVRAYQVFPPSIRHDGDREFDMVLTAVSPNGEHHKILFELMGREEGRGRGGGKGRGGDEETVKMTMVKIFDNHQMVFISHDNVKDYLSIKNLIFSQLLP